MVEEVRRNINNGKYDEQKDLEILRRNNWKVYQYSLILWRLSRWKIMRSYQYLVDQESYSLQFCYNDGERKLKGWFRVSAKLKKCINIKNVVILIERLSVRPTICRQICRQIGYVDRLDEHNLYCNSKSVGLS